MRQALSDHQSRAPGPETASPLRSPAPPSRIPCAFKEPREPLLEAGAPVAPALPCSGEAQGVSGPQGPSSGPVPPHPPGRALPPQPSLPPASSLPRTHCSRNKGDVRRRDPDGMAQKDDAGTVTSSRRPLAACQLVRRVGGLDGGWLWAVEPG